MHQLGMFVVAVPLVALVCFFAAIGLAKITHGDEGAELVCRLILGPRA